MAFSWEPGINITPPTADADNITVPTSFDDLTFDPQGVYDLRRMLGSSPSDPQGYKNNQHRFDAADVAWFASGCATDGRHAFPHDEVHPIMTRMYLGKFEPDSRRILKDRTRSLVFDAVCIFCIHIPSYE